MSHDARLANRRILVVDDNQAIHDDFRKILGPRVETDAELLKSEAALFGDTVTLAIRPMFDLDFAFQGEEALAKVKQALIGNQRYAMAFMDVRMPPGWDGIETTAHIWQADPDIQIVICTAYSDHTWEQIRRKLGNSDRLVILKKPFDNIEVLQLAEMLTEKWRLAQRARTSLADLERVIHERTRELQASQKRLDMANQQLLTAARQESDVAAEPERSHPQLVTDLRRAIDAGELSMHYQPVVDIETQRVVSLEALVRWQHPNQGFISPATFIPVAEKSGLIIDLGEFVLKTVCEQIMRWEKLGIAVVPVAVNVSPAQLVGHRLWPFLRSVLRDTGVKPAQLILELTESALISDVQNHIKELGAMRSSGIKIAIDDFGTGYSSLSYLRQLPIDSLKIDRSFISHVDTNTSDQTIVEAILTMAHSLGFIVVAEGVETEGQLEVLRRQRCDLAQGYLFSRPLSADHCRELLQSLGPDNAFSDTLRQGMSTGMLDTLRAGAAAATR
jgi:EAL domain-containing protein (putative c-di-GMP-specific phosphodiesterase class I)/DNA-binding NarL/FixJ family response regulator